MAYSKKVMEHYENPNNVGSFPKDESGVGTGIVGAPECGDVMKLQIKVIVMHECAGCHNSWEAETQQASCPLCNGVQISVYEKIIDARFKTFGCGSAIASSSYLTELVKGKTIEEAQKIKNSQIVKELSLPPVKIHCSVLAEDAIKAAIADWKKRAGTESQKTAPSEGGY
ncbi:MAG TPA: iron-sulfur cluster assembly scaffold protein [Candidatus Paceibacterota bacterium]